MPEQILWRAPTLWSVTHVGKALSDTYKNQLVFSSAKHIQDLTTEFFSNMLSKTSDDSKYNPVHVN